VNGITRTEEASADVGTGGLGADFGALIEALYRPGGADADWLRAIVDCARPGLDRGAGAVACLFVAAGDRAPVATTVVGSGPLPAAPEALVGSFLPALAARAGSGRAAVHGDVRTAGGAPGGGGAAAVRACWGIAALAGTGRTEARGCALFAPLQRGAALPRATLGLWSRVAEHLRAALILRHGPRPEELLWRGLVNGRWSVIDHFDAGGRRFVIARRGQAPPGAAQLARLSVRERAACAGAALGRANKVIAAELGIAVSTVGMLLLRAGRKLGCTSREELIRVFRLAEERWGREPSQP
jgi:DNA-binding CsgD family transcriptional regulator